MGPCVQAGRGHTRHLSTQTQAAATTITGRFCPAVTTQLTGPNCVMIRRGEDMLTSILCLPPPQASFQDEEREGPEVSERARRLQGRVVTSFHDPFRDKVRRPLHMEPGGLLVSPSHTPQAHRDGRNIFIFHWRVRVLGSAGVVVRTACAGGQRRAAHRRASDKHRRAGHRHRRQHLRRVSLLDSMLWEMGGGPSLHATQSSEVDWPSGSSTEHGRCFYYPSSPRVV